MDSRLDPSGSPAAGSFITPGPGRLSETRGGLTHPIQTAEVLHHVLICVWVIVDHGVLFVHTSRLSMRKGQRHSYSVILIQQRSFVQGLRVGANSSKTSS